MLDVIGDLALNKSFGQVTSGKEHQYVVDFNNAFMLIGLVSGPDIRITFASVPNLSSKTRLRQLYP
jgi:hypothetical protein